MSSLSGNGQGRFYIIGNCISYYIKKPPAGCALRRTMMMSQATAAGARMYQGTFFVLGGNERWIGIFCFL